MPRPRKLTDEAHAELERIAHLRMQTPSDKELAYRFGVSVRTIEEALTMARKKARESTVSCGTNSEKI